MMPAEVRKKLQYIEINSNRAVRNTRAGDFRSRSLGRGFEFDEHRPYRIGDDYRMIDWNVTARLQHPYLKKHFEEKELSAILVLDASRSMFFGSGEETKRELLLEVMATLAFSAVADNLRLGLLLFTNEVELYVPPRQGRTRVWNMLDTVWSYKPASTGTNIEAALRFLLSSLSHMTILFFLSDFIGQQDLAGSPVYKVAARRHDFVPIVLGDALEENLPEGHGLLRLRDAETGEVFRFRLTARTRDQYKEMVAARKRKLTAAFFRHGAQHVNLRTNENYISQLMEFFLARRKK